jgi:hypothetical protein
MNRAEVKNKVFNSDLFCEYLKFIYTHPKSDHVIYDGDMILKAVEECFLLDEFVDHVIAGNVSTTTP